jgi:hypothetical protein
VAAFSGARAEPEEPVLAPGAAAESDFELALEDAPGREFRDASPCQPMPNLFNRVMI